MSDAPVESSGELHSGTLLPLVDPDVVYPVGASTWAVFAAPMQGGKVAGRRSFLFEVGRGGVLFGAAPDAVAGGFGLVAMPVEGEALRGWRFGDVLADPEGRGKVALARWERHIREAIAKISDAPPDDAEPGITGPPEEDDEESARRRLDGLHERLFGRLAVARAKAAGRARARADKRDRVARDRVRAGLEAFASLAEPSIEPPIHEASDLLEAAVAVGRALGVAIRAPLSGEDPTRLANPLEAIARASRIRIRRVALTGEWWRDDCGPLLAFEQESEKPLALLPVGEERYEVYDPSDDSRKPVDSQVARVLEREAWMFYRPLPERALKLGDLGRFALKGRASDVKRALLWGTAGTLLGMVTPIATGVLIDLAIPDADRGLLGLLGLALAAAAFGGAIFQFAQGLAMLRIDAAAEGQAQAALWDRLLNLRLSFFRRFSTGDLQSRVSAVNQMGQQLTGITMRTIMSSGLALLNLGLLLYYSPMLTLVALAITALVVLITVLPTRVVVRRSHQLMEAEGRLYGFVVQLAHGIVKIRGAGAEDRAFSWWGERYRPTLRLQLGIWRIEDAVSLANQAVPIVGTALIFGVTAQLVTGGGSGAGLTTGAFLAFYSAFGLFINAAVDLSNAVVGLADVAALSERARPILEATPEVDETKADPGQLAGRIDVEHVTFRYREDGRNILDDVSVKARAGEFVALVGPSGSGKSTLLKLLLAFETPNSGRVLFDGQDLSGLNVHGVRRQIGVVMQSGTISAGSIFDIISAGSLISMDDAWQALGEAGLAGEVRSMPMGLHTFISEGGGNLSGGQRQRLLIARALVGRPKLLLLDEATSALDNQSQSVVTESLDRLAVTRIVVAHRLNTVRDADRIYVIDNGRVVQSGSFEELAAEEGGLFHELMSRQMA